MRGIPGTVGGKISGTVKVATVYSVGLHKLPPKMREFMTKFPAAKIDLEYSRTTRVVRDVLNGTVELGIVAFPESQRGLTIVPMASDRLVLICSPQHEFAGRQQIKVIELKGLDFVLFERDVPTRKAIDKILKSYNVKVNKAAEFDNIETIKRSVEVGFGLAIVPYPSVMGEERNKQLAVIKLAEKDWIRPVGVIYRSNRTLSIAAKNFVRLLATNSDFKTAAEKIIQTGITKSDIHPMPADYQRRKALKAADDLNAGHEFLAFRGKLSVATSL